MTTMCEITAAPRPLQAGNRAMKHYSPQHLYRCKKIARLPFVDDGFEQCESLEDQPFTTENGLEASIEEKIFLREVIAAASKGLSDRQKFILIRRFYYEDTLEEVGRVLAVSPGRVRQIEGRALIKMRKYWRTK